MTIMKKPVALFLVCLLSASLISCSDTTPPESDLTFSTTIIPSHNDLIPTTSSIPEIITSNNDQNSNASSDYFETPKSEGVYTYPKFFSYSSHDLPEELMSEWDSETLLTVVLDYPELPEMVASAGRFGSFRQKFNGINELLNREDCASVVLERYKNYKVLYEYKTDDDHMKVFKLIALEIMLAQNEIICTIDDDFKLEIFNAVIEKMKI